MLAIKFRSLEIATLEINTWQKAWDFIQNKFDNLSDAIKHPKQVS